MDIDVVIEGISDRTVADAIRTRVRKMRKQITRPGKWHVTFSPSETRGQWNLGLRGASGWHLASFTEGIDHLPDLIERKLREFLNRTG